MGGSSLYVGWVVSGTGPGDPWVKKQRAGLQWCFLVSSSEIWSLSIWRWGEDGDGVRMERGSGWRQGKDGGDRVRIEMSQDRDGVRMEVG